MFTSSEANTFSLDQYLNIQTKIYSRVQDAILIPRYVFWKQKETDV